MDEGLNLVRPIPSMPECILYTACEFWAATVNGELGKHLESDAEAGLRNANRAFFTIGATDVVRLLHIGRAGLACARCAAERQQ